MGNGTLIKQVIKTKAYI